jgi:HEAT repeat protein
MSPPNEAKSAFSMDIERWGALNSDETLKEADRLVKERRYPLLIAILREARYYGRAAEALQQCGDTQVARDIIGLLADPSERVRMRAASALGPLGGEDAARALCSRLPQAVGQEVLEIAYALDRLPWAGAIQPLIQALHRATDFFQRVYLAKALARSGGQEGFDFLIAGVNKADAGQTENAQALLKLDHPQAIPALKAYLQRLERRGANEQVYRKPVKEFLARHGVAPD